MGQFGGFYKGEKKKSKKDKGAKPSYGEAPVFSMPEIITDKKKQG